MFAFILAAAVAWLPAAFIVACLIGRGIHYGQG